MFNMNIKVFTIFNNVLTAFIISFCGDIRLLTGKLTIDAYVGVSRTCNNWQKDGTASVAMVTACNVMRMRQLTPPSKKY